MKKVIRATSLAWILVIVAICLPQAARSQDAGVASSGAPAEQEPVLLSNELSRTISIEYHGGTVEDFVLRVKEEAGEEAILNIIIRPDVANEVLPRIELRNVSIQTVLESMVPASAGLIQIRRDDESGDAYLVIAKNPDMEPSRVLVVNIHQLLNAATKQQLTAAIEEGIRMLGSSSQSVKLQLHEETGLLFARGTQREMMLIREICDEMMKGSASSPFAGQDPLPKSNDKR